MNKMVSIKMMPHKIFKKGKNTYFSSITLLTTNHQSSKNPEVLADAIEKLLKNPKLREKMGKSGRKEIEKDFNIKTEVKRLEKVFLKL